MGYGNFYSFACLFNHSHSCNDILSNMPFSFFRNSCIILSLVTDFISKIGLVNKKNIKELKQ